MFIFNFILILASLRLFNSAAWYASRDIDGDLATKIQKVAFAKDEYIIIRHVLQHCIMSQGERSQNLKQYSTSPHRMAACIANGITERHSRNLTLSVGYDIWISPDGRVHAFTLNHPIGNVKLILETYEATVKLKIKLKKLYRIQLHVKHFNLHYIHQCPVSWMAYQDSDNVTIQSRKQGCYKEDCLDSYFEKHGTIYGRYCGALKSWKFHSAGNYLNIMLKISKHHPLKRYIVKMFYQAFSIKETFIRKNIVSGLYTLPGIYHGVHQLDVFSQYDTLFYIFHLQTFPGFLFTTDSQLTSCEYFNGPDGQFTKLSMSSNGYLFSSGHIVYIYLLP